MYQSAHEGYAGDNDAPCRLKKNHLPRSIRCFRKRRPCQFALIAVVAWAGRDSGTTNRWLANWTRCRYVGTTTTSRQFRWY